MEKIALEAGALRELPGEGSFLVRSGLQLRPEPITPAAVEAMAFALTKMAREQQTAWLSDFERMVCFRGPERASNARLVEWEDGSRGMYIGERYFDFHLAPNDDGLVFGQAAGLLVRKLDPAATATLSAWQAEDEL